MRSPLFQCGVGVRAPATGARGFLASVTAGAVYGFLPEPPCYDSGGDNDLAWGTMSDTELCYLSAGEALGRFKARRLSPVELMQAVIARAQKVEPKINAFPIKHYDRALEQAKAAESKYMKTDGRVRPLEGLPIAIKDEAYIKGERVTFGSLIYKDFVADETNPRSVASSRPAPSCTRARQRGVLLRALHPFAPVGRHAHALESRLFLRRLVRRLGRQPGRRSTTIASGSDIGGSIRIPASMCGVVGYKPPFGRNPDTPPFNSTSTAMSADGAQRGGLRAGCRTSCAARIRRISPPCVRSCASPRCSANIKGWRIALCVNPAQYDIEPDVAKNTRAAADLFRAAGATVEEVEPRLEAAKRWHSPPAPISAPSSGRGLRPTPRSTARSCRLRARFRRLVEDLGKEDFLRGLTIEGRHVQIPRRSVPEIPHPALPDPAAAGHQSR